MYCTNCGNQINEGSKFCDNCGFNLNNSPNQQPIKTKKKEKW